MNGTGYKRACLNGALFCFLMVMSLNAASLDDESKKSEIGKMAQVPIRFNTKSIKGRLTQNFFEITDTKGDFCMITKGSLWPLRYGTIAAPSIYYFYILMINLKHQGIHILDHTPDGDTSLNVAEFQIGIEEIDSAEKLQDFAGYLRRCVEVFPEEWRAIPVLRNPYFFMRSGGDKSIVVARDDIEASLCGYALKAKIQYEGIKLTLQGGWLKKDPENATHIIEFTLRLENKDFEASEVLISHNGPATKFKVWVSLINDQEKLLRFIKRVKRCVKELFPELWKGVSPEKDLPLLDMKWYFCYVRDQMLGIYKLLSLGDSGEIETYSLTDLKMIE